MTEDKSIGSILPVSTHPAVHSSLALGVIPSGWFYPQGKWEQEKPSQPHCMDLCSFCYKYSHRLHHHWTQLTELPETLPLFLILGARAMSASRGPSHCCALLFRIQMPQSLAIYGNGAAAGGSPKPGFQVMDLTWHDLVWPVPALHIALWV